MSVVMQHCFGADGTGGPIVAFRRLQAHATQKYPEIVQSQPAGGFSPALLRTFVREIRAVRPRLIHVRGLGNEGFHAVLAAKLAGVPNILLSVHGTQRDLVTGRHGLRRWVVVNVLERITLELATHIATVSVAAGRRDFLRPYSHKLVGAVPNGVAVAGLADESERRAIRASEGLDPDAVVAICVSRVTEEKGYLVLANALGQLDTLGASLELLVIGGGDQDCRIRARFSGLRHIRVRFLGHRNDVGRWLSAADFFVFPSLHENLSNALLEAMGNGLPTIATAVGGNVEVLANGGGLLVPVGQSAPLAEAIMRLTTDAALRGRLGKAALVNIVDNYSTARMVQGWQQIYAEILGTAHG